MMMMVDPDAPCRICDTDNPIEPLATTPTIVHRDCLLRNAIGGIGHHLDHSYWCENVGDHDGGCSARESARRVAELVTTWGVEAVVNSTFPGTMNGPDTPKPAELPILMAERLAAIDHPLLIIEPPELVDKEDNETPYLHVLIVNHVTEEILVSELIDCSELNSKEAIDAKLNEHRATALAALNAGETIRLTITDPDGDMRPLITIEGPDGVVEVLSMDTSMVMDYKWN